MSTLRNAVQRRPHRERAQPVEREKLGLLEKHKDYSLRAKDFNAKKARLRALREKAKDRNLDEFHFAMMSSRVDKDGVKIADRGNTSLSVEVVKLLKTQDAGYLRTMAMKAKKERARLEEEIQLIERRTEEGDGVILRPLKGMTQEEAGQHTVFVDDEDTQQNFSLQEWFQTDEEGLRKPFNRRRNSAPQEKSGFDAVDQARQQHRSPRDKEAEFRAWREQRALQKKHDRDQERRRERLAAVREKEKSLLIAEQELDQQRAKMNSNIGGINKNGVKFKIRERKK